MTVRVKITNEDTKHSIRVVPLAAPQNHKRLGEPIGVETIIIPPKLSYEINIWQGRSFVCEEV